VNCNRVLNEAALKRALSTYTLVEDSADIALHIPFVEDSKRIINSAFSLVRRFEGFAHVTSPATYSSLSDRFLQAWNDVQPTQATSPQSATLVLFAVPSKVLWIALDYSSPKGSRLLTDSSPTTPFYESSRPITSSHYRYHGSYVLKTL